VVTYNFGDIVQRRLVDALFPLTPALSLGERETPSAAFANSGTLRIIDALP
jgi:hypothetical protein